MRRDNLFWGTVLLVMGGLLLLDNLGIFNRLGINVWSLVWPTVIILLGVRILWGTVSAGRASGGEAVQIPIDGAEKAEIQLQHGAGRLRVGAGAKPGNLLEGTFGSGLDYQVKRLGETLSVDMGVPSQGFMVFPWTWVPGKLDWTVHLNENLDMALKLKTGANETQLDLAGLQVTELKLQTGASSTMVTLPAKAGFTKGEIESGVASLSVRVPQEVALRLRVEGGLSGIQVDTHRFPRSGGVYQSTDYDSAANRIDLFIKTGVGSVDIR